MNSDVIAQLNRFIGGCSKVPEIERVLLHGSSLYSDNPNDIDIVILFKDKNNKFDLYEFATEGLEAHPKLFELIKSTQYPYSYDITYTSNYDLCNRARKGAKLGSKSFYFHILNDSVEIYNCNNSGG